VTSTNNRCWNLSYYRLSASIDTLPLAGRLTELLQEVLMYFLVCMRPLVGREVAGLPRLGQTQYAFAIQMLVTVLLLDELVILTLHR
jgi:hypothetical protein